MINLLPPETKVAVKFARLNVTLIQYCILVVIVSVAVIGVLLFGLVVINTRESRLQASITDDRTQAQKLEPVNTKAKELSTTINTISGLLKREIKFSVLLDDIGSIMPTGTVLTGLTLSDQRDQPLTLDALVVDEESAAVLRENLAESELFQSADIVNITRSEAEGSTNKYQFTAQYRAYFKSADTKTTESKS